jgi:hypothetical protein
MASELRVRSGVEWRQVDGRIVAMDVASGDCVALNRTGAALWPALVGGADEDQLARVLVTTFGIDEERARTDIRAFLAALRARALLAD